ncbi:hypothetical protein PsorP6_012150 [Peronosclerospora sorghi]|uniref:Uncharacterized protein n=1 Tax=Peronosclerospora sorghi TaxID=230839 RepID=A0ACC0WJD1_9STRA|nr:hypothetical protein PsorP6_012150 [Peronosclerospora sorghi]
MATALTISSGISGFGRRGAGVMSPVDHGLDVLPALRSTLETASLIGSFNADPSSKFVVSAVPLSLSLHPQHT